MVEPDPPVAFVPAGGGEPLVIRRDGEGLGELRETFLAVNHLVAPLLYAAPAPLEEVEDSAHPREGARARPGRCTPVGAGRSGIRHPPSRPAALPVRDGRVPRRRRSPRRARRVRTGPAAAPRLVVGGTKALALGLFRAGARAGVQFRAVADVTAYPARRNRGGGAVPRRREYAARAVVSTLDPKTTFLELIEEAVVPDGMRAGRRGLAAGADRPIHRALRHQGRAAAAGHRGRQQCADAGARLRRCGRASPRHSRRSAGGQIPTPRPGI